MHAFPLFSVLSNTFGDSFLCRKSLFFPKSSESPYSVCPSFCLRDFCAEEGVSFVRLFMIHEIPIAAISIELYDTHQRIAKREKFIAKRFSNAISCCSKYNFRLGKRHAWSRYGYGRCFSRIFWCINGLPSRQYRHKKTCQPSDCRRWWHQIRAFWHDRHRRCNIRGHQGIRTFQAWAI